MAFNSHFAQDEISIHENGHSESSFVKSRVGACQWNGTRAKSAHNFKLDAVVTGKKMSMTDNNSVACAWPASVTHSIGMVWLLIQYTLKEASTIGSKGYARETLKTNHSPQSRHNSARIIYACRYCFL
jgi:hypothetical protein